MNQTTFRLKALLAALIFIATLSGQANAQGGGAINPSSGPSRPAAKPSTPTTTKTPAKSTSPTRPAARNAARRSSTGTLDRIDGKWWTVGNGFGDSEVVFTQNGGNVSGVIRYADGRTGSITGTLVGKRLKHSWTNSSGVSGTGWLELSWANFLGGPWRNERIRDGSWTLRRIEGKWCFGGDRNRVRTVTHNERGELLVVTEDGSRDVGRLEGPSIFLDSEYGSIEGEMFYKGNRIDWSSGAFWTWCGR